MTTDEFRAKLALLGMRKYTAPGREIEGWCTPGQTIILHIRHHGDGVIVAQYAIYTRGGLLLNAGLRLPKPQPKDHVLLHYSAEETLNALVDVMEKSG